MTEFIPAKGIANPHLQTILTLVARPNPVFEATWQTIETPDGDFLELAWSEPPSSREAKTKPLFVLFHGLEGHFDSPYANGLMDAFAKQGWLSVMMHFRGCSGRMNRKAKAYHAGETNDARHFLEYLEQHFPSQTKVAVGISLGGNMLVNYLAKYSHDPILSAATTVSAPLDLNACFSRMEQGFSKVYRIYLLRSLKKNALKKAQPLQEAINIDTKEIKNIRTILEFDDKITAPLHGFNGAKDYYQQCSGIHVLNQVKIPLQIIHAQDDPFMTDKVIPNYPLNENIHYRLLKQGGHVGFLSGSLTKPIFWLEKTLPSYYSTYAQPKQ